MLGRALGLVLALLLAGCGETEHGEREVAVKVGFVAVDKRSGSPVVLLEEWGGTRSLPIWIGFSEAQSIASEMEEVRPPRPNTHDLAKRLIRRLDGSVERVVVTELRRGTYYASLVLRSNGKRIKIDARPSDAIAIALRVGAPLYVREQLLDSKTEEEEDLDPGERVHLLPEAAPSRTGIGSATSAFEFAMRDGKRGTTALRSCASRTPARRIS
jgi:bifunctional DNase/RNase